MWGGNADSHACVCVQDARIPSQDAAYTLATLDNLCTVCNTCQFIPLQVNYNISRYHTCSHAAHGPNIAFQRVTHEPTHPTPSPPPAPTTPHPPTPTPP